MSIVFFGSSEFSVPFLNEFYKDISLVVTTKEKVRGRGSLATPNPVRLSAEKNGLKYIEVDRFDENVADVIKSTVSSFFLVVSFAKKIPQRILSLTKCPINLHPSPLPKYRGAAPIERQLMDGVTDSKICVIRMTPELDAGDVILAEDFKIDILQTKAEVERTIIEKGIPLIRKALGKLATEGCVGKPQQGEPTYAPKISKEDETIVWWQPALSVHNRIRALSPKPGAYSFFRGKVVKIYRTIPHPELGCGQPGSVLRISSGTFFVCCGGGSVEILELQLEGRKRINARDFVNGMRLKVGETFK